MIVTEIFGKNAKELFYVGIVTGFSDTEIFVVCEEKFPLDYSSFSVDSCSTGAWVILAGLLSIS